jgi:flagellar motor switch protein FliN/FliY
MIVDQDEIESLLAQADTLATEAKTELPDSQSVGATEAAPVLLRPTTSPDATPEVARILKIRVPLIVQLATRRMSIESVRKLSLGMIIEFNKSVDEPLELLINNHPVGFGDAVRVNERFGVRISQIRDAAARIKSMGK